MPGALPSGLGNDQQATQATAFIRQQPWYLDWLKQQGITPGQGDQVKLNDTQRAQLMALAVQNGIGFNNKYDMIDENGQIAEEHHKLKKVAIAAAIAGLAVTGLGAAGIGPLAGALGGAGAAGGAATGAGVGLGETAATTGIAGATALGLPVTAVGAGLGATAAGTGLAGLAPLASTSAVPATGALVPATAGIGAGTGATGAAGAITAGSKFANILGAVGKVGNALSGSGTDANGNPVNAPQSAADAARAQALTNNRFLQAPIDQRGPAADAEAQRNMLRAGLISRMNPNATGLSIGGHALPNLAPTSAGTTFSQSLQDKLAARMAAGKSLTLSGVQDPTQEELDAQAAAQDASGTGTGVNSKITGIGNTINQGIRYAQMGKGIYDTVRGLF